MKIPKWKYADKMSFVRPHVRARDTVTNLEFDRNGETDEEASVSVSEVAVTEILQETKSTHSSEYSSGSPDVPGIKQNRVCVTNSASARTSESAQLQSSTSSNMVTYYRQFTSLTSDVGSTSS